MKIQHTKHGIIEKAELRGKFIELNAYIKKEESTQINNLMLYFKEGI